MIQWLKLLFSSEPALISKRAQQQLREMRDSGDICCLELRSDYNFVWGCRFVREAHDHDSEGGDAFNYDTADEAIGAAYERWKLAIEVN